MEKERAFVEHIEKQRFPWAEEIGKKLDEFIQANPELQARIKTLRNPALDASGFVQMIDSWNSGHKELVGYAVERKFVGANGEVLMIRMDNEGNVILAGHYDHSNTPGR